MPPSQSFIAFHSLCLPPLSWLVLLFGSHATEQCNLGPQFPDFALFFSIINQLSSTVTQWQGTGQQSYAAARGDKSTQTHRRAPPGSGRDWDTQRSVSYLSLCTTAGSCAVPHATGCDSFFVTPYKAQRLSRVSMAELPEAAWVILTVRGRA